MQKAEGIPSPEPIPNELGNNNESAKVPLMITRDMRQQLADRGLSKENISEIKPEDAWEILNGKKSEEQQTEQSKLTPEEQITNIEGEIQNHQNNIDKSAESIKSTRTELNKAYEEVGLPPPEEEPPSISQEKERLERIKSEQQEKQKQKEELRNQQEKEKLIQEEKEKILQEKLDEIFKEFEAFTSRDLQSIFKSGKTRGGKNIESSSMGELDPEIAKSLAKAFKEGIKLLPQILELLPDLLKKFDKDLTKEAKERLEKKMEEDKKSEKEKTTKPEEQKPKDESEISENKPLEKNIKQDPLHSKIKKPAA